MKIPWECKDDLLIDLWRIQPMFFFQLFWCFSTNAIIILLPFWDRDNFISNTTPRFSTSTNTHSLRRI